MLGLSAKKSNQISEEMQNGFWSFMITADALVKTI